MPLLDPFLDPLLVALCWVCVCMYAPGLLLYLYISPTWYIVPLNRAISWNAVLLLEASVSHARARMGARRELFRKWTLLKVKLRDFWFTFFSRDLNRWALNRQKKMQKVGTILGFGPPKWTPFDPLYELSKQVVEHHYLGCTQMRP